MENETIKKKINITKLFLNISYIYIAIPVIIFFALWTKWYFALVIIACILFGLIMLCRKEYTGYEIEINKKTLKTMIISLFVIILWAYLSGIGGFVFQNGDHVIRNEIFDILVSYKWPVVKNIDIEGETSTRGIIYYIAFWLPSALVGKTIGLEAGYFFQLLWTVIGLFLFYITLSVFFKKVSLCPLLVFIFFSGLDIVGTFLFSPDAQFFDRSAHIEWWSSFFQFSSFTTQLFWVFNQAMPLWIVTMLVLLQRDNRHIVFIMGLAVLYGPFPFIGLVPICIAQMLSGKKPDLKNFKDWIIGLLKETLTIENIICGGIVGITSYLYFKGNSSAQLIGGSADDRDLKGYFFMYFIFIMLEAGVYFIAIAKASYKKVLFYVSLVSLLIIPFIKIGYGGDFCMRVSIPALVVLYLLFIESFSEYKTKNDKIGLIALVVIFLLGAVTPFHEINRTVNETKNQYINAGSVTVYKADEYSVFSGENFTGDIEDSFFYEWLSR